MLKNGIPLRERTTLALLFTIGAASCGDSAGEAGGSAPGGAPATGGGAQPGAGGATGDGGAGGTAATGGSSPGFDVRCAHDNGGIQLPAGFCASVYADGVFGARQLAVAHNGDVFVAVDDASSAGVGGVVVMRDLDRDGVSDLRSRFGDHGGNGIAIFDGHVYFAENGRIVRYYVPMGSLEPSGAPDVIVAGMPSTGEHVTKSIVFAETGEMLVSIGSASNACQEANRVPLSPGLDPCPELNQRAGVWRFSQAVGQTMGDGVRIATGLRDGVAIAMQPFSDALVAVQVGRDALHETWPALYSPGEDQVMPGEELFLIAGGEDLGWPYCYFDPTTGTKVLAPEYGGNGQTVGRCVAAAPPAVVFPAHSTPLGIAFYRGALFPAKYIDGAFVAFHGSQGSGSAAAASVAFVPFEAGLPTGTWEPFATGFEGDATDLRAAHRPVGVAMGEDQTLYITDDEGGRIWKVTYVGS